MPIPGTIPTVKVKGTYYGPDGRSLSGTITFTIPALLTFPDSDLFVAGPVVAQLDENGKFEVTLPATDAPGMNPSGWSYTVKENLTGVAGTRTYAMLLPKDTPGGVIDLADVAPADPTTPTFVPVAGSQILTGSAAPTAALGVNNDFYVQYDTRTLLGVTHTTVTNWKKSGGTWAKVGGDVRGSAIYVSSASSSSVDAKPGDLFVRSDTGNLYQRDASGWGSSKGSLKGPQGDTGAPGVRGSKVYEGPVGEIAGLLDGDVSIVPGTGLLYWREGGAWVNKGNIRGPQGIQGIQGPKGDPGTGNVNTVNAKLGPDIVLNAADVGAVANTVPVTIAADATSSDPFKVQNDAAVDLLAVRKSGSVRLPTGNLYVDKNLRVGGAAGAGGIGSGITGVLAIDAGTGPSAANANGVNLYTSGGKLVVQEQSGTTFTVPSTALVAADKGANNGVASLDGTGKLTAAQKPTYTAAEVSALATTARGAANGVASLGSDSKVPIAQLPAGTANGVATLTSAGYVPAAQIDEAIALKSSDTSRASTATSANDPHLTVAVAANATYAVEAVIVWTNGGGGMRVDFGAPSGATMVWTDNDGSGSSTLGTDLTFSVTTGTTLKGALKVGATAGTLALRWAQNTSNAGATVLKSGCYISARRIA